MVLRCGLFLPLAGPPPFSEQTVVLTDEPQPSAPTCSDPTLSLISRLYSESLPCLCCRFRPLHSHCPHRRTVTALCSFTNSPSILWVMSGCWGWGAGVCCGLFHKVFLCKPSVFHSSVLYCLNCFDRLCPFVWRCMAACSVWASSWHPKHAERRICIIRVTLVCVCVLCKVLVSDPAYSLSCTQSFLGQNL